MFYYHSSILCFTIQSKVQLPQGPKSDNSSAQGNFMGKKNHPFNSTSPFNRTQQHDAKRQTILAEAARLFNRRGSRSTTLQDIATSLNLSKTSLYYYVKTKQELVYQCYLASCEHHAARIASIDRTAISGQEKLRQLIFDNFMEWRDIIEGRAPHYALLLETASLGADQRALVEQRFTANVKGVRNIIANGIADQSVAPCDATSTALCIIGTLSWSPLWLLELEPAAIESAALAATDILLRGMHADAGTYRFESLVNATDRIPEHSGFDQEDQNRRKREAFLKTGSWFFNRKGYKGTSLDEIALQLEVTKGAFYYHIKDKEDLLQQCFERSLELTDAIQNQALKLGKCGIKRLEISCRSIFYLQNSSAGPLIRYNNLLALPAAKRAVIMQRTRRSSGQFGTFIEDGIDDGSIRLIDATVAQHMLAGANMAAMEVPRWKSMGTLEDESIDYFHVFFNGLLPR
jgi:AcrR family transcriptional regulator